MGLDSVELVMAFEQRFALAIPNADAERLQTTRDVIDYVFAALRQRRRTPCPTQTAFYGLRRLAPSQRVRPGTPIDELLPMRGRRAAWSRLPATTGLGRWPALTRPHWLTALAWVSGVAAVLAIGIATSSLAWAACAAIPIGLALARATRPLARCLPPGLTTVGALARCAADWNTTPADGTWTRDAVRRDVRAVVRAQIGLDDSFSDDDGFVAHLGLS